MNTASREDIDEHVSNAMHYLSTALRAELAGCLAEALPLAKQAEYECAQLVYALEVEMRG